MNVCRWCRSVMLAVGWLVLLPWAVAVAEPLVEVTGASDGVPLVPRTELLDPLSALTPQEALRRLRLPDTRVVDRVFSHSFTADTLWSLIDIEVAPAAVGRWYLALELPNFDRLEVYRVTSSGTGQPRPVPFVELGDKVPAVTDIPSRFHLAPLDLEPGRLTLLVRGRTASTLTLPLTLWRLDALLLEEQNVFALQMFYLGISAVLFLAALALFAYTRQAIYFIYLVNLFAHSGIWLMINGVGPGHLWPGLVSYLDFELHALVALSICTVFAFTAVFLSTSRIPKLVQQILWGGAVIGALLTVGSLLTPQAYAVWMNLVIANITLPLLALLMVPTIIGLFRREPAARPLMLTWVGLILTVAIAWLRNAGLIPSNFFVLSVPQLGSVFEALVFGYMLVDRLGRLQHEKEALQQAALEAAREQEVILENRVADRTAELDAANSRLQSIIRSAPFPLILVQESDSRILYANQRACDLVGKDLADLVGTESRRWFVEAGERDRLLATLTEGGGVLEDQEVELLRGDGSAFWALLSVVRLIYDGRPARLVALNDISRLKDLEQDLRRTAELEAAAAQQERYTRRLQQRFVAMVSHEFRTPLAIIDGAAQNLRPGSGRDQARLQKIRTSVVRLLRMIDTYLIDERVTEGAIALHAETADLRDVALEAVDAVRTASPDHVLVTELPDRAIPVTVDIRLTEVVLNNLLENAVKYSPAGSTVSLALEMRGERARLVVTDQGDGIPDGERERIFDKFYRAPNTAGTAGAGLGLYLCRALMTEQGGEIRCEPSDDGARFVLDLPLAETDDVQPLAKGG